METWQLLRPNLEHICYMASPGAPNGRMTEVRTPETLDVGRGTRNWGLSRAINHSGQAHVCSLGATVDVDRSRRQLRSSRLLSGALGTLGTLAVEISHRYIFPLLSLDQGRAGCLNRQPWRALVFQWRAGKWHSSHSCGCIATTWVNEVTFAHSSLQSPLEHSNGISP